MNTLITTPEISQTPSEIAASSKAEVIKAELLAESGQIILVASEKDRDLSIAAAGHLKGHIKEFTEAWKAEKKPFLDACEKFDKLKASHLGELESNLKRLNGLSGAFEADRQRKLQAEAQRLRDEQDRLAREVEKARLEALRLQREADERAAKLAAKGKEPTDAQKAKALEAQLEADEKAEAARLEMTRIDTERALAAERQAESRPTGGSLREEIDITVFDLHALYRDCPQAVKLNPDVVFLKGMARRGIKYAGVTYTPRAEFRTRAS